MKSEDAQSHLSQITTPWTMVCRAHQGSATSMQAARQGLLERYGGAIQRYLRKCAGNVEAARDLYQDFALCFVKGDFRRVSRERGRFRDYIKGVLFHLIADHRHRQQRQRKRSEALASMASAIKIADVLDPDGEFLENWRDELLAKAWSKLQESERRGGQALYTVLRFRADHPDLSSPEMAKQLSDRLNKPLTADASRQLLHRARKAFADFLIEEIVNSLETPTPEAVEDELTELGLLSYCRPRLTVRRPTRPT